MTLHHPAGTLIDGAGDLVLTPDDAGWLFTGLRVVRLDPGRHRVVELGASEAIVLPLSGGVRLRVGEFTCALRGRSSVFAAVSDFAFAPRGSRVELVGSDAEAEIALCTAVASADGVPAYVPAEAVSVEVRGAGPATRQVVNFGVPGSFDGASRVMACELITPGGNWSSYPPHKHDDTCAVSNEEIYYFRVDGPGGFALHRTYDDRVDLIVEVHDRDVCLVPHGYHGPTVAAPGYDLYYLNVLAGLDQRSMAFCDDPAHHWVRDSWANMAPDPRCPLTCASGRVGR